MSVCGGGGWRGAAAARTTGHIRAARLPGVCTQMTCRLPRNSSGAFEDVAVQCAFLHALCVYLQVGLAGWPGNYSLVFRLSRVVSVSSSGLSSGSSAADAVLEATSVPELRMSILLLPCRVGERLDSSRSEPRRHTRPA